MNYLTIHLNKKQIILPVSISATKNNNSLEQEKLSNKNVQITKQRLLKEIFYLEG